MQGKTSLKATLGATALAAGLSVLASSSFAQEDDAAQSYADQYQTVQAIEPNAYEYYNGQFPIEYFYLLAGLAAAASAYGFARRTDGAVLRSFALATGLAAIANPQEIVPEYRDLPTVIPVFVDKSPSVGHRAPSIEEAFKELETQLSLLGPVEVRRVEFGQQDQAAPGTQFSATFSTTLSQIPANQLGGAFVLSDGVIHDQSAVLETRYPERVHALIVGHEAEQDFHVRIEKEPHIGRVGETPEIAFRIVNERYPEERAGQAEVNIAYAGNVLQTLTIPVNERYTLDLADIVPEGLALGDNVLEISIADVLGLDGAEYERGDNNQISEVSYTNNSAVISIDGLSSEVNGLLLSGNPHRGTALWREVLNNNPHVNLTHMGYMRPVEKEDATPLRELATIAFPVREIFDEKLDEYAFVVLDNYAFNGVVPISYLERLNDYVVNGGGLIVVGSEDLTAPTSISNLGLGEILPFMPGDAPLDQRFIPQISEEGVRHPVTRSLTQSYGSDEWGPWYSIASGLASDDARVLMQDEIGTPLLSLNEVGEGRIAVLSSDQAAIWASGHLGGGPADALYNAMTGWVLKHPGYEGENLNITESGDEIVISYQTLKDEPQLVVVTTPSGDEITVMPQGEDGVFSARLLAEEQGVYRARRASNLAATDFMTVGYMDSVEAAQVISNADIVRAVTDEHNGQTARVIDAGGLVNMPEIIADAGQNIAPKAMAVNMTEKKEMIGTHEKPIVPQWLYGLVFVGLSLGSWRQKEMGNTIKSVMPKWRNDGPELSS